MLVLRNRYARKARQSLSGVGLADRTAHWQLHYSAALSFYEEILRGEGSKEDKND